MKRTSAVLIGALIAVVGCATIGQPPPFRLAMVQVDRPQETKNRYGAIVEAAVADSNRYSYEDSLFLAYMIPMADRISFRIENKTPHTIKIVWDESAFIDITGAAQRVMHAGVKYVDRNSAQPSSVIPGRGFIEDFAVPAEHVYLASGMYSGGWQHQYLIVDAPNVPAESYRGKRVGLLLAVQIQDVVNEYTFWFEVTQYNRATSQQATASQNPS